MNTIKKITYVMLLAVLAGCSNQKAKYVFYFIGDGMGVNQVNCTEMYKAALQNRIGIEPLQFASFPYSTLVNTFSATAPVTDSAAGGTALATGIKTYNGAIGLDAEKNFIPSVALMAQEAGVKVGVTTSVSIDHATPGAFYAHQESRTMYHEIALDLPKAGFDFYAGSGFLKPVVTNQETGETVNVFDIFQEAGYTLARGYDDYKEKAATASKMILMEKEGKDQSSLSYAIDRQEGDLTLAEITESAIDFLTKDNDNGFFLMVEGGKIDWACHANDIATLIQEIEDFDNAINVAYEFYKQHPDETLIVITADHETGGLIPGTGHSEVNLEIVQHQKVSINTISEELDTLRASLKNKMTWDDVKGVLSAQMGFWTNIPLTPEQEQYLKDEYTRWVGSGSYEANLYSKSATLANRAKEIMAEVAKIGWTSTGHSATYVPVYAIGVGSEFFGHRIDNTEIAQQIAKAARYQ